MEIIYKKAEKLINEYIYTVFTPQNYTVGREKTANGLTVSIFCDKIY